RATASPRICKAEANPDARQERLRHKRERSPKRCAFGIHHLAPYRTEQTCQRENQHANRETPGRNRALLSERSGRGQSKTEDAGGQSYERVHPHHFLLTDMMNRIADPATARGFIR